MGRSKKEGLLGFLLPTSQTASVDQRLSIQMVRVANLRDKKGREVANSLILHNQVRRLNTS